MTATSAGDHDTRADEDAASLQKYVQDKFAIAHQVRRLEHLLRSRESTERAAQCQALTNKLAEDRFTLAVVGQFKRGKSSLMNAIIGRAILPTGVLPLTSAITILRFGPRERLMVAREDLSFEQEMPLAALVDYVTEQGNPGNQKKLRAASIEVPAPFLRRGLEFADTPGIGSAIAANTATTNAFIPHCDAVIFVTSVDAPMTEAELEFLRRLRGVVGKVFCAVNKVDLLEPSQWQAVIDFVAGQMRTCLGSAQVPVFPVSSRWSLEAQGRDDTSGIAALREALSAFLAAERTAVLLEIVTERALRLLAAEREDLVLAERTASSSEEARRAELAQAYAKCECLQRQLAERMAQAKSALYTAVIETELPALERHVHKSVVQLSDSLLSQVAAGRWQLAQRFVTMVAHTVRASATLALQDWLASRHDTLIRELSSIWRDLAAIAGLASTQTYEEPSRLHLRATDWTPVLPWPMRSMPMAILSRYVRRWLRPRAAAYGQRLISLVISGVERFLDDQLRHLGAVAAEALQHEADRITRVLSMPDHSSPGAQGELAKQKATLAQIEHALLALLHSVAGRTTLPQVPPEPSASHLAARNAALSTMAASIETADIRRDLRAGGCTICRRLSAALFDFFATWQYLLVTDDAAQHLYADERGFCPLHTWQLAAISSPQALSVGYPRLLARLRQDIRATLSPGPHATISTCRACRFLTDLEGQCARSLTDLLTSDSERRAYTASGGVCLQHVPLLLAAVTDVPTRHFLLDVAASRLQVLVEDMQSFALKREARRRELLHRNEEHAWYWALEHVAGAEMLCCPRRMEEPE
jgi:GTP-binding protein EngB required for normal cell division